MHDIHAGKGRLVAPWFSRRDLLPCRPRTGKPGNSGEKPPPNSAPPAPQGARRLRGKRSLKIGSRVQKPLRPAETANRRGSFVVFRPRTYVRIRCQLPAVGEGSFDPAARRCDEAFRLYHQCGSAISKASHSSQRQCPAATWTPCGRAEALDLRIGAVRKIGTMQRQADAREEREHAPALYDCSIGQGRQTTRKDGMIHSSSHGGPAEQRQICATFCRNRQFGRQSTFSSPISWQADIQPHTLPLLQAPSCTDERHTINTSRQRRNRLER